MATNRAKPPKVEDLLKLPRWARVAFAARCARRVQPLLAKYWKNAPKEHIEAVDRAITLSEASARVGRAEASLSDAAYAAAADAAAADAAATYPAAAADAADAAAFAARAAAADDDADAARDAAYAAEAARADADAWSDYDRLFELATAERWTHDTPVDPDRLGPLWPYGKPKDWPKDTNADAEPPVMQVDILVPAGLSDHELAEFDERLSDFFGALSGLHASMGGSGLRILDEGSCEVEPIEDEAPTRSDHDEPAYDEPVGSGGAR